jgi:hypothetical protein
MSSQIRGFCIYEVKMADTILTLHPQGKQGVRISKEKYEVVRDAILNALRTNGELTFSDLTLAVQEQLRGHFDGSISWYVTTVKLDLEARGQLKRVPESRPQRVKLP